MSETKYFSYFPNEISDAQVLIMGTFPSNDSIASGEYYKNSQNQFWQMLEDVLEYPGFAKSTYKFKESILKQKGIVIWDSIKDCKRENGSSDGNIIEDTAIKNDIYEVLKSRTIKIITINGVTERNKNGKLGAKGWFEKFYGKIEDFERINNIKVVALHSTHGEAKKWFKISEWRDNIRPYIIKNTKKSVFIVKKKNI